MVSVVYNTKQFVVIFVAEKTFVCTSADGQLMDLWELWNVVSDAVKLDAANVDLWKVMTQQVNTAQHYIMLTYKHCEYNACLPCD